MFKKIKEKSKEKQFRNGYDYAAGELLRGEKTPLFLDSEVYKICGNDYDSFDAGIDAAIQDAVTKGLTEDDRI